MRLVALAASLALAGCVTTGENPQASLIIQAQEAAKRACSYLPAAHVVAQISGTQALTAAEIAGRICMAINLRSGRSAPTVNGVLVTGERL
jgi:hypothetical protein